MYLLSQQSRKTSKFFSQKLIAILLSLPIPIINISLEASLKSKQINTQKQYKNKQIVEKIDSKSSKYKPQMITLEKINNQQLILNMRNSVIGIQRLQEQFTQIPQDQFQMRYQDITLIQVGSYAQVSSAYDIIDKIKVAIKQFKSQIFKIPQVYQQVTRQICLLQLLKTFQQKDYFVNLLDKFIITMENGLNRYCIITQLCECSFDVIIAKKQKLFSYTFAQRLKFCLQIAQSLNLLHQNNILHRDLKPANILLHHKNNQPITVLADFNQSKQCDNKMTQCKGSPQYVDPYLYQTQNYGFQWDVYSYGLIMLQILTGKFLINVQQGDRRIKFQKKMKQALENLSNILSSFQINQSLKVIISNCLGQKKLRSNMKQISKVVALVYSKIKQEKQEIIHNKQKQKDNNNKKDICHQKNYQQKNMKKKKNDDFLNINQKNKKLPQLKKYHSQKKYQDEEKKQQNNQMKKQSIEINNQQEQRKPQMKKNNHSIKTEDELKKVQIKKMKKQNDEINNTKEQKKPQIKKSNVISSNKNEDGQKKQQIKKQNVISSNKNEDGQKKPQIKKSNVSSNKNQDGQKKPQTKKSNVSSNKNQDGQKKPQTKKNKKQNNKNNENKSSNEQSKSQMDKYNHSSKQQDDEQRKPQMKKTSKQNSQITNQQVQQKPNMKKYHSQSLQPQTKKITKKKTISITNQQDQIQQTQKSNQSKSIQKQKKQQLKTFQEQDQKTSVSEQSNKNNHQNSNTAILQQQLQNEVKQQQQEKISFTDMFSIKKLSNSTRFNSKLLQTLTNCRKNLQTSDLQFTKITQMQVIQNAFKKIKKLQQMSIEKHSKRILIALAYLKIKLTLKTFQTSSNQQSKKDLSTDLALKIHQAFLPLINQATQQSINYFKTSTKAVLAEPSLQAIQHEFVSIVKNISTCDYSKLIEIIK